MPPLGIELEEGQEKIVKEGGEISSSVSKKVDAVIVKSLNEDTAKVEKARELKLNIIKITKKKFKIFIL